MNQDLETKISNKKAKKKLKLMFQLIKKGKSSDRELAKNMQSSNTSIGKLRSELEREGLIKEYTIIPDFNKLGLEIIAFTFVSQRSSLTPELLEKAREWLNGHSEVIFGATEGNGSFGANSVMISVHKNYGDYLKLLAKLREEEQVRTLFNNFQSFLITTNNKSGILKEFSLRYLENAVLPRVDSERIP